MDQINKDMKIEIKVDENTASGIFSNFANISHSSEEFIFDFLFVNPTPPPGFGKLVSRIVITPAHAKRLKYILEQNIKEYESRFQEIKIHNLSDGNNSLQ